MFKKIKNWLTKKNDDVVQKIVEIFEKPIDYSLYQHKWLDLYQKKVLLNYIEEQVLKLSNTEGIKIFQVSFDEVNVDEPDMNKKAIGLFIYTKSKKIISECFRKIETSKKTIINISKKPVPRIEITEKGDVFTTIHELGHYFLYKRDQEQSEFGANLYIDEFFDNYLPPFFKWIYQIEIKVIAKKELIFTDLDNYNHWNEYNEWIKNNNDYGDKN